MARFSLETLSLPAPISELCDPNAEPNEIWVSVFGGSVAIFVCMAAAIMTMLTQAKVDREGKEGNGESKKERTHTR